MWDAGDLILQHLVDGAVIVATFADNMFTSFTVEIDNSLADDVHIKNGTGDHIKITLNSDAFFERFQKMRDKRFNAERDIYLTVIIHDKGPK